MEKKNPPTAEDAVELFDVLPPVRPYIVPIEECNPRGGDVAKVAQPVRSEDPRIGQLRQAAEQDTAQAMGQRSQIGGRTEPASGRPPSAASYFRVETALDIAQKNRQS
jgi:hypothetical protein